MILVALNLLQMNYEQIVGEASKFLFGGVLGTLFTNWYKKRTDKTQERKRLFFRMIASKGYYQIPQMLIDDLNTIEILFRGKKEILRKYHAYYADLCLPLDQVDLNRRQGLYWDLLRGIGNCVGYNDLDNETLHKSYIPTGVVDDHRQTKEFQKELLGYLVSGQELHRLLIAAYENQAAQAAEPQPPQ